MANKIVSAEEQVAVFRKLHALEEQVLRRGSPYPYDLTRLTQALQGLVEGWGIRSRLVVKYDDVRWDTIDRQTHSFVLPGLEADEMPSSSVGTQEVEFQLFKLDRRSTTRLVLSEFGQRGLRPCCRAEAETFLDDVAESRSQLSRSPILAPLRVAESSARADGPWGIVMKLGGSGLSLNCSHDVDRHGSSARFLGVRVSC